MKFLQSFSYCTPEDCIELAKSAEAAGFNGVSIGEHLLYPKQLKSKYPYTADDNPIFEANEDWTEVWTTSAAMAAVTKTLEFSTSINILPMYNPFHYAKVLATVARLSNNRVSIGAGSGWMMEEFNAMGVDFKSRGRRYTECIELMRKLWTGDYVSHQGEFFQCDEVIMLPKPSKPIPIWISGKSQVALKRAAAMGDGWMATGEPVAETIQLIGQLQEYRKEQGRDHLPFDIVTMHPFPSLTDDEVQQLKAAGATAMMNWAFKISLGGDSSLQQKQDYLADQQGFIQRHR